MSISLIILHFTVTDLNSSFKVLSAVLQSYEKLCFESSSKGIKSPMFDVYGKSIIFQKLIK